MIFHVNFFLVRIPQSDIVYLSCEVSGEIMSGHPTTVSAKPDTLVRVVSSEFFHIKHISPFVINTGQGGKETIRQEFLVVSHRKAIHTGLNT